MSGRRRFPPTQPPLPPRSTRSHAPTPTTVPYRINDPRPEYGALINEDEVSRDEASPSGALRQAADDALPDDPIERLAVLTVRLTDHQVAMGKRAQERDTVVDLALAGMVRREAAWAGFWEAMRLLPAALLALISHRWAAVIYAVSICVGVLHLLGVTAEAMAMLVHAFGGLVPLAPGG